MSEKDFSTALKEKKHQRLILALSISLAFNALILIGGSIFWHAEARTLMQLSAFRPCEEVSKEVANISTTVTALFDDFSKKSFSELMLLFSDKTVVEDGIRVRDVALSCAISEHYFDVVKALGRTCNTEKVLISGKEKVLVPGLNDDDFARIVRTIERERFPYTSEGFFVKFSKDPADNNVQKALMMTPEYIVLETLLQRVYGVSSREVLLLVPTLSFSDINELYVSQKKAAAIDEFRARKFLVNAMKNGSKGALMFLIQRDAKYVFHELEDQDLVFALQHIEDKDIAAKASQIVIKSKRRETVKEIARGLVTNPQKGKVEEKKTEICKKRLPQVYVKPPFKEKTQKKSARYIIQKGDTLFSISKKFRVDVQKLKVANHLATEALQPGSVLEIPY